MGETTKRLRELWKEFECDEDQMVVIPFGPDRIRVAPPTAPAWEALAAVLLHHGYEIRTVETDSYNCRNIKGTKEKSLHSYGIALDVNWHTNPWVDHAGRRKVRFSDKLTQDERADDVRSGDADTDFTKAIIDDALAIKTPSGNTVFEWGGHWTTVKDCMHFEIDLGPDDLSEGIDEQTVVGWEDFLAMAAIGPESGGSIAALEDSPELESAGMFVPAAMGLAPLPGLPGLPPLPGLPDLPALGDLPSPPRLPPLPPLPANGTGAAPSAGPSPVELQVVNARSGLILRSGPGQSFSKIRTLPLGTTVNVIGRDGPWAQVDLQGDGASDGFVHSEFLRAAGVGSPPGSGGPATAPPVASGADILDLVTVDNVKPMFPATSRSNISRNLPFVLSGLRSRALVDKPMVLMALGTIRAETEGFVPISEGRSRFNTAVTPFDLYDAGTRKGRDLGNTVRGDGPKFKGRGYVQLTGRDNYTRIGTQIRQRLVDRPDLANDPTIAGIILAQFLKNKESRVRAALAANDLRLARKLVNGGSHGLARFKDAFRRGVRSLPG